MFYKSVIWMLVVLKFDGTVCSTPQEQTQQLLVHMSSLLQDLQGVASHLEILLSGKGDQLQDSSLMSQCLDKLVQVSLNTSLSNTDLHSSIMTMEDKLRKLEVEVQHLEQQEFTVSVASEGGCCPGFEHSGPWFQINCKEVPFNMRRGLNIVAVSRAGGKVVKSGTFDTYLSDVSTAKNMVEFIQNEIPDDSVVLVAGFDSFVRFGQFSDCQEALWSLGAQQTTFGNRDTYALIGYKGSHYGKGIKPEWVKEGYFAYPGETDRNKQQTPPITLHATINKNSC